MAVDEQQPLLQGECPQQCYAEFPDAPGVDSSKPNSTAGKEARVDTAVLAVMILGAFLSLACESMVASTQEEIASDFNALSLAPWLLMAYSMGYSMILPLYGSLVEVFGCKQMLLFAYAVFGLGCLVTGSAVSMYVAIVGRFIASIGGAGMVDLVSILLNKMAPLSQVAVLRSYLGVGMTMGVSCGSPLGGILADTIGWRWSFLCQVPIAFVAVVIAAIRIPPDAPNDTDLEENWLAKTLQLDLWGYLFLVIGIVCALFFLHLIGNGDPNVSFIVAFGTGCLASMAVFAVIELHTKKSPIIPIRRIFKDGVGIICAAQIPVSICQFAIFSNVASFLIHTENAPNSIAGIPLVLYAVGAMAGSLGSAYLVQRTKRCNLPSIISCLIAMISCALILIRWRMVPYHWEMSYTMPIGAGLGALFSLQYLALSIRAGDGNKSASIITTYYLSQQIGATIGTASSTCVFRIMYIRRLLAHLGNSSWARRVIKILLQNNQFASTLAPSIQAQIRSAFLESFQVIPAFSLVSAGVIIPMVLGLKDTSIE